MGLLDSENEGNSPLKEAWDNQVPDKIFYGLGIIACLGFMCKLALQQDKIPLSFIGIFLACVATIFICAKKPGDPEP